jgi:hypothetical protein
MYTGEVIKVMADWYIYLDNKRIGPLNREEISRNIETGMVRPDTLAWTEGMTEWARVDQIAEFLPPNFGQGSQVHIAEEHPPPLPPRAVKAEGIPHEEPESPPLYPGPIEPDTFSPNEPEPPPLSDLEPVTFSSPHQGPKDFSITNDQPGKPADQIAGPDRTTPAPAVPSAPTPPFLDQATPVPVKKGKKKLVIALAALAVIIIGGAIFAYSFFTDRSEKTTAETETTALTEEAEETAVEMPPETRGNTTGNIVNGGFVVESDGWFYLSMPDDTRLMKIKADGSEKEILVEEEAMYINIIGDWLYYVSDSDIVKIRTDGTERTIVDEIAAPMFLNVVDDWIYYYVVLDLVTGSGIYKIGLDGEEKTLLSDARGYDLSKVGNWIYFSNWSDDRKPYKMNLEGEEVTRLTDDEAFDIQVYDNMLYYTDALNVHRIGIDGSDRTVLDSNNYFINDFIIDEGWIYFFNPTSTSLDTYDLIRMNPDSAEFEVLQEIDMPIERTIIPSFNIAGGWIFLHAYAFDEDYERVEEAVYRMRTDGSGFELVLEAE